MSFIIKTQKQACKDFKIHNYFTRFQIHFRIALLTVDKKHNYFDFNNPSLMQHHQRVNKYRSFTTLSTQFTN